LLFPSNSPHPTLHRFEDKPYRPKQRLHHFLAAFALHFSILHASIAHQPPLSLQSKAHLSQQMLVPKFSLHQTAETVVVTIKLPYVRVGDAEVSVVRAL